MTITAETADREQQLECVLADFLAEVEAGKSPDADEWMRLYPELHPDLGEFFALHRWFKGVGPSGDELHSDRTPVTLGGYQLLEELGAGGMGVVYRARQTGADRLVALKMIRAGRFATASERRRFRTEIESAARLDHPHIVPVYEVNEAEGHPFFTMKLLESGSLAEHLARYHQDPRGCAELVAKVADAIHFAHQHGILHRDLKPSNILVDAAGQPHVADFGLAKQSGNSLHTGTGDVLGTPAYMAPEQALGGMVPVTTSADVYGLGAVLYACLTGGAPFQSDSVLETMDLVRFRDPAPPRGRNPRVPRDLEAICLKCLRKNPRHRYASAAALALDLRRWQAGEPIEARPPGRAERAWKWARRNVVPIAFLALVATAAVSLFSLAAAHVARMQRANVDLTSANARANGKAREAEEKTALAERRAAELRRQTYASQFRLAGQHWQDRRHESLTAQLNSLRPRAGEDDLRGFEWRYLWRQGMSVRHVGGHLASVDAVAFSPDGTTCATGAGTTIRLWRTDTAELLRTLDGHTLPVWTLAFSPDGRRLASGAQHARRSEVRLWDVADGRLSTDLGPDSTDVFFVAFGPTSGGCCLIAAGNMNDDPAVRIWDLRSTAGPAVLRLAGKATGVTGGALSPDGRWLAVAYHGPLIGGTSAGSGFQVWDLAERRLTLDRPAHDRPIYGVAFSPDNRTLATGSEDGTIRLWDVPAGRHLTTLRGGGAEVHLLCFSRDGQTLVSGDKGMPNSDVLGTVSFWDVAARARRGPGLPFIERVTSLAYSPDGGTLAVGTDGRLLRLLKSGRRPDPDVLAGHGGKEAWSVAFSPDGRTLATAGDDHNVRLWEVSDGSQRAVLGGHESLASCVAFSPDGLWIASGSFDNKLRVWTAPDIQLAKSLNGHTNGVRCAAFSPDSRLIASGGKSGQLKIRDLVTGLLSKDLSGTERQIRCVAFSNDCRYLAVGGDETAIRVYEVGSWRKCQHLACAETYGVAFFRDGTLLAGHKDGGLRLWDPSTGRMLDEVLSHAGEIRAVAVSPDGKTFASADADGTVRLWHTATRQELLSMEKQSCPVNALAFSPDGRTLAAARHDGQIRLWRAGD